MSPVQVLEMNIKIVWIKEYGGLSFVLTVIDTFIRGALYGESAYQFKERQVNWVCEYIIENYLQPFDR